MVAIDPDILPMAPRSAARAMGDDPGSMAPMKRTKERAVDQDGPKYPRDARYQVSKGSTIARDAILGSNGNGRDIQSPSAKVKIARMMMTRVMTCAPCPCPWALRGARN